MALELANLVYQTTTTEGTGNLTVASITGFQTFSNGRGTGSSNTFPYFIRHQTATEWEVGIGYMSDASTLVRSSVLDSSNAGSLVDFSAGTKNATIDVPSSMQIFDGGDGSNILATSTGSTEARELADRFADYATPEDFGAVGDGVADDTAAFIAALATGKRIKALKKTYVLTGTIPFVDNAILELSGSTININTSGSTARGLYLNEVSNAWIIGQGQINVTANSLGSDGSFNSAITIGHGLYVTSDPDITQYCGVKGDIKIESIGTANAKAIYISGYCEDILINVSEVKGQSNFAIAAHWGGNGSSGVLPTKTWHPNNIVIERVKVIDDGSNNTLRAITFSACGRVIADGIDVIDCPTLGYNLFVGDYGFTYSQNVSNEQAMNYTLNNCIIQSDARSISCDGVSSGLNNSPIWSGADYSAKLFINNCKVILKDGGDDIGVAIHGLKELVLDIDYVEELTGNTNEALYIYGCKKATITGNIRSAKNTLIFDCGIVDWSANSILLTPTPDVTSQNINVVSDSEDATTDGAILAGATSIIVDSASNPIYAGGTLRYNDGSDDYDMAIESVVYSGTTITIAIEPSLVAIPDSSTVKLIETVKQLNIHDCIVDGARILVNLDGDADGKLGLVNIENSTFKNAGLSSIYAGGGVTDLNVRYNKMQNSGRTTTTVNIYDVFTSTDVEKLDVNGNDFGRNNNSRYLVYANAEYGFVNNNYFRTYNAGATNPACVFRSTSNVIVGDNVIIDSLTPIYNVAELEFTPELTLVTVTHTNQVGRYKRSGNLIFFEIEIDFTGLNTADGSAITIEGLPYAIGNNGFIFGQFNAQDSTGLSFSASDTVSLGGNAGATSINFTDMAGTLLAYNSGKMSASGQIILSGHYFTD